MIGNEISLSIAYSCKFLALSLIKIGGKEGILISSGMGMASK
jgi:hypothetical protein